MRDLVVHELKKWTPVEKNASLAHRRKRLTIEDRANLLKSWGPVISALERHASMGRVVQEIYIDGRPFQKLVKFDALGKDLRDYIRVNEPKVLFDNLMIAYDDIARAIPWPASQPQPYYDLVAARKVTKHLEDEFYAAAFIVKKDEDDTRAHVLSKLKKISRCLCCCLR